MGAGALSPSLAGLTISPGPLVALPSWVALLPAQDTPAGSAEPHGYQGLWERV